MPTYVLELADMERFNQGPMVQLLRWLTVLFGSVILVIFVTCAAVGTVVGKSEWYRQVFQGSLRRKW